MKLIKLLFCVLLMFSCSDDDNLMDSGSKKGCDSLQGEKISEVIDVDAKIVIRSQGDLMPYVYSTGTYIVGKEKSEDAFLLIVEASDSRLNTYFICNLPNSIKKMSVNTVGIDVVLSGNIYLSENPVSEGEYQYFELTKLKKK